MWEQLVLKEMHTRSEDSLSRESLCKRIGRDLGTGEVGWGGVEWCGVV